MKFNILGCDSCAFDIDLIEYEVHYITSLYLFYPIGPQES